MINIALVGYGKMGHMIAQAAALRGNRVVCTVDPFAADASCLTSDAKVMAAAIIDSGAQVVIEFSHPKSVLGNIAALLPTALPLVVGTTGWNDKLDDIRKQVLERGTAFFTASNFSLGVNLFYRMVAEASRLMAEFEQYDVAVFEAHHNQKADSPSGTGLDVARRVLDNLPRKKRLVTDAFYRKPEPEELHLASLRVGAVPGTHSVFFDSPADTIELTHTARNREGFAMGAVRAAEWLCSPDGTGQSRRGMFSMDDLFAEL